MPILKSSEINPSREDFEETVEHSPYFDPNIFCEQEISLEEKTKPTIPFWKVWWKNLKSIFSKL